MKGFLNSIRPFINEAVLMLCFILLLFKVIGVRDEVISGDGVGYYDQLPSLFIHHDLHRKDAQEGSRPEISDRIEKYDFYVDVNDHKVNKYPCGTALLELPFFLTAYFTTELEGTPEDGYQTPFHRAVLYSAFFYLFLTLLLLKRTLREFHIDKWTIVLLQGLLVFGTGVTHYASFDASYSHVYSLFAITGFFAFTRSYFRHQKIHYFLIASTFFGIVLLLRQANGLVLFFTPFLAGSPKALSEGIRKLFQKPFGILSGILIVFAIFSIQSSVWFLQTGSFLLYSYKGEGFDFADPAFYGVLFSYRTGLFLYTPLLLLAIGGIVWLLLKRELYMGLTWLFYFTLITYIFSSWWAWSFGCSFGHRAYVDHYTAFFIPIGLLLNGTKPALRGPLILLAMLTVPVNLIQTYQYRTMILHWCNMDRTKYWKIFLRTDEAFEGLVWNSKFEVSEYRPVRSFSLESVKVGPDREPRVVWSKITDSILDFSETKAIKVEAKSPFEADNRAKLGIRIKGKGAGPKVLYHHEIFLIHLSHQALGKSHTGSEIFKTGSAAEKEAGRVELILRGDGEDRTLQDLKLTFLERKKGSND